MAEVWIREYRYDSKEFISQHGKPCSLLWNERSNWGMASYESENRVILIMDNLIGFHAKQELMLIPKSWGKAAARGPSGLVALHDGEDAKWTWRPLLYKAFDADYVQALGSQRELEWRFGMMMELADRMQGKPSSLQAAREKADDLLWEHLSPQQRIELTVYKKFPVRGGATGNLYAVEPGNGFQLISKWTRKPWASFCFHPEEWVPDSDVALATMFALEDPELEIEFIGNANSHFYSVGRASTAADRHAKDLEKDLIVNRSVEANTQELRQPTRRSWPLAA